MENVVLIFLHLRIFGISLYSWGQRFVDWQKIFGSWGRNFVCLLHYNARQFTFLFNIRWNILSWVKIPDEIHKHSTRTSNNDSTVTSIICFSFETGIKGRCGIIKLPDDEVLKQERGCLWDICPSTLPWWTKKLS